jgi:hypothetical protein
MNSMQTCPRCGAMVTASARWCWQCGLVPGAAAPRSRPATPWRPVDALSVLIWAIVTVSATALWYQWLAAQTAQGVEPDWGKVLSLIVAPLLGLSLGMGAIAGALIRRDGPKVELLLLAAIGAACLVFTVSGIASSDATQCDPNSGCDVSYGMGAILEFPFVLVPFLGGTAIGRAVVVLLRRRRPTEPSLA